MLKSMRHRGRRPGHTRCQARLISIACDRAGKGWHLLKLAAQAGLSERAIRKILSQMRTSGAARYVDVYVPAKLGRGVEARAYVKLADIRPPALDHFERCCCEDPSVATAAFISGPFSYVLTTFHHTEDEAFRWSRTLGGTPGVDEVKLSLISTKSGHLFAGIPLWG